MYDRKVFQKQHPIAPQDEFIVMFAEKATFSDVRKTLTEVFNKHGRGKIAAALPGGTTLLIKDVNWDIVDELKQHPSIEAIGPNRKARFC